MQKEIQNKKINKKGFSLIETIISIFLITVGLIASVQLITTGLRESMDSRDQLIAIELAQEGVELVRNIRDNNWVQGTLPNDPSFYYMDEEDSNIDKDFVYGTGPLPYEGSYRLALKNGFYVKDDASGDPTKFYRKVLVTLPSGDVRSVVSVVVWNGNGSFPIIENCNTSTKCAFAQTTLSRWGEGSFN